MTSGKYDKSDERALAARWEELGIYRFSEDSDDPVYSIDTPPTTVSGYLHMGHVFSYSQADFMARFHRMHGHNVFYPMGYDDNGLPTDRLVEQRLGRTAEEMGREAYVSACLATAQQIEQSYEEVWRRLGLSVDWRHTYRTIDDLSRRTSQQSFIDLYGKDLAYRRRAPTIWCPHCHTAIAQAEVHDLERESELVTLVFRRPDGRPIPVATTRAEMLPACVAVFVNPTDDRYADVVGESVQVPLFDGTVPVLADWRADPEKGTGAVMCCTFGDTTDVEWWYQYNLPLREVIDREGRLMDRAGPLAALPTVEARRRVVRALEEQDLALGRAPIRQTVRVHERCDTPVEYIVTQQWFIRVLDQKDQLLRAGEQIAWHPAQMHARYREWVQNLHWDWSISRQRYFGVHFPVWYCTACGEILLADEAQLPVNPMEQEPPHPCRCGSTSFVSEEDVMDTWATSSLTPQIAGRRLSDPELYGRIFPMSLRPQAHEIIRTWACYTIVKSQYEFGAIPWKDVLISGWALASAGGKLSKSRGGPSAAPMEIMERHGADAVRYWAASVSPGKDAAVSEDKIRSGGKLVTKLWNLSNLGRRFLDGYGPLDVRPHLSPADRWILSRTQRLIEAVTASFRAYDYSTAKNDVEAFFWHDLADNYVEMAKKRLYDPDSEGHGAARYTM